VWISLRNTSNTVYRSKLTVALQFTHSGHSHLEAKFSHIHFLPEHTKPSLANFNLHTAKLGISLATHLLVTQPQPFNRSLYLAMDFHPPTYMLASYTNRQSLQPEKVTFPDCLHWATASYQTSASLLSRLSTSLSHTAYTGYLLLSTNWTMNIFNG